jgi:hypothetical protein
MVAAGWWSRNVLEMVAKALSGDAQSLEGAAALVSIVAIIPAALIFTINQLHQNGLLRDENHKYVTERWHVFLDKCITLPELRLEYGDPVPAEELGPDKVYQRDVLFDLLTSIFERAYVTYAKQWSSHRRRQWRGWDKYVDLYISRSDYQEWWLRVPFRDDRGFLRLSDDELSTLNASQYDLHFERYMFSKLREKDWSQFPDTHAPRARPARTLPRRGQPARRR